ncbi:uncharacterized protein UHOD_11149 [Ustilago sp. UG-2017b]|nr:uncharacterized protein UHOD_11149 [Ustilago sp. UG-2017b]
MPPGCTSSKFFRPFLLLSASFCLPTVWNNIVVTPTTPTSHLVTTTAARQDLLLLQERRHPQHSWHPACLPHRYLLHEVPLSLSQHRQLIFFNPAARSHQSPFSSAAKTVCVGPTFAPAASVIALGARVDGIDSRIGRLEDTIHLNFATILTCIDSLQSSPHPPSTPTSPAAVTASPSPCDTIKPERLILLCNPESHISKETPAQAGLVFTDGQVRIAEESSKQRSSSFAKVIPNICALAQVWLVYTAIHIRHTQDLDLNDALLAYLEILIEFDQIYLWKGVTEYHLAICRQRFGTGVTHEWAHTDTTLQGRTLLTKFQTPATPSSSAPSSKPGAKSSRPGRTTANPPPVEICMHFNLNWGCSGCNRPHICANCYEKHPVQSCGTGSGFKSTHTNATQKGA